MQATLEGTGTDRSTLCKSLKQEGSVSKSISDDVSTQEAEETNQEQKLPLTLDEKGNNSGQTFAKRRQFSKHLRKHSNTGRQNKMVQTFITGDFFVNTANVYTGDLVE